jgi:hypothetical protein
MVHFPGFASRPLLYSGADIPKLLGIQLKDSEIPRSQPVCGSLRLIAAYCVLLRLPSPRHPPCALSSLTIKFTPPEIPERIPMKPTYGLLDSFCYPSLPDCQRSKRPGLMPEIKSSCHPSALDFQHSPRILVEVSGIEPLTPCLQSRCSSS